jgi:hypothetical protein
VTTAGDARTRLTDPGNNGRLEQWRIAIDTWKRDPVTGSGAGTYQVEWARERPNTDSVVDAHSLIVETLSDLGAVGLALLLTGLAAILVAFAARIRGPNRALYGGLTAAALAWLVDSAIDWHWEMPATTLWLFALGGMALARRDDGPPVGELGRPLRLATGAALLVVLVTPAQMAISQARLSDAHAAVLRGDCKTGIDSALAATEVAGSRAEPFELLAYCDARIGAHDLAQRAAANAIDRDPDNWEYHYDMALVRGAAGVDPRSAAREALRLNPRGRQTRDIARAFDTDDPAKWRKRALEARLLLFR